MQNFSAVLIIILTFTFCSCKDSTDSSSPKVPLKVPSKVSLDSSKAVFLGQSSELLARISIPDRIHNTIFKCAYAENSIQVMYQVNSDDTVSIVTFEDSDGNEITVNVTDVKAISPKILGIAFTINNKSYITVTDPANGVLYDMSVYNLPDMTAGTTDTEMLVLYNNEIRKVNFTTQTYTALNNTTTDPVSGEPILNIAGCTYDKIQLPDYNYIYPLIVQGTNVLALVPGGCKSFDINGVNPPTICSSYPEFSSMSKDLKICSTILSSNSTMYSIWGLPDNPTEYVGTLFFAPGNKYTVICADECPTGLLPIQDSYTPTDGNRYVIIPQGYIKTNEDSHGIVTYSYTEKDMNFLFALTTAKIKQSVVYGLQGKSFVKADIINDTALTTLYTSPTTVATWNLIAGNIYFTSYDAGSATSVSTYELVAGTSVPVKLSTSDMKVGTIIPLSI